MRKSTRGNPSIAKLTLVALATAGLSLFAAPIAHADATNDVLILSKVVSDATPSQGDSIDFDITARNNGPHAVTNFAVVDLLDFNAFLPEAASATQGTYEPTNGVWTIGTLASGVSRVLTITVSVLGGTACRTFTNTATVSDFTGIDPVATNNTKSVTVTVNGADLSVTKIVNSNTLSVGNNFIYSVFITNKGPIKANNISITDVLPTGVKYVSSAISQGTAYNTNTGVWVVNDLNALASANMTITCTLTSAPAPTVTNAASVTAVVDPDSITSNNTGRAAFTITGASFTDFGLSKTVSTNNAVVGTNVSFTIAITNFGTNASSNVKVLDALPVGLSYVSNSAGTNYDPASGIWTVGDLAVGDSSNLTIAAIVNGSGAGLAISNQASFQSATVGDNNADNNVAGAGFQAGRGIDPDLAVPPINLQVIPAGSYIIPMDTNSQRIGVSVFNMKAYGLVSAILYSNCPVKWAIRAGKGKDEADFSASVQLMSPSNSIITNLSFFAGPFIVDNQFTNRARGAITAFGNNVAVYRLISNVTVDVRYTITHKPRIGVFDDGGTDAIHTGILDESGIPTNHYTVLHAAQAGFLGSTSCFTFCSSPHYDGGLTASQQTTSVRTFLESGGNFLAQCAAVRTYENASNGQFQTDSGFEDKNDGVLFIYPNADTPPAQFQGVISPVGGSLHDWGLLQALSSKFTHNAYKTIVNATSTNAVNPNTNSFRQTTAKIFTNTPGGVIFYLGGHSYGTGTTLPVINGRRVYMNAIFVPVERPNECGISFTVDLSIDKSDNIDPIVQGNALQYSLLVSNAGPFAATGVIVTDNLPAQVTFVNATPSVGTYTNTGSLLVWNIGPMGVGNVQTMTIDVLVSSNFVGIMTNIATVSQLQGDITLTNNVDVEPTTVICETNPPSIECPGDITIQCTESSNPTNTGTATASDDSDTNVLVTFTNIITAGSCGQESTITRIWTALDDCGNTDVCTQFIEIVDTVAPILNGVPSNTTNQCDNVSTPASVTATDSCDAVVSVSFTQSTNLSEQCVQNYTLVRVWSATDDCANAVSATQFVSVVDTTAPVLSGQGTNATIECPATPVFTKPIATDNCDTNPIISAVTTTNAGPCAGAKSVKRVWVAYDACSNLAAAVTQIVTIVDTISPTLFDVPGNATNQCDNVQPPPSVTATDACVGPVSVNLQVTTNAGACAQAYFLTRIWSASDSCSNSIAATQIVSVIDTTAPQLSGQGTNMTIECPVTPVFTPPIATDNCDTGPVVRATTTTNIPCAGAMTLTRTWVATDHCANASAVVTQIITVVDTTAPTIICATNQVTLPGDANCQAQVPELSATATDICNNAGVTITQLPPAGTIITGNSNTIVTLWATDACGNSNFCQTTITVICPGGIHLQKTVYLGHNSGASCPGSESVSGTIGDAITYCFSITNSGAVTLTNVVINDSTLAPPFSTNIGTLAVGQVVTVYRETTLTGNKTNVAITSGIDPIGRPSGDTNTAQTVELNSISGFVFKDADADGIFDPEDITNGIPGVTVNLYGPTTNLLATLLTDTNGFYIFTNLPAGGYFVMETDPAGFFSTADVVPPNDNNIPVTLVSGTNVTQRNFLDALYAAIGDFVWFDNILPANGLQNLGEPGQKGARLTLLTTNGAPLLVITSGVNGVYFFTNVIPGTYIMKIGPPPSFSMTTNDVGGNDNIDSDFFQFTLFTAPFSVAPGEIRTNMDAGLTAPPNFAEVLAVAGRFKQGQAVLTWETKSEDGVAGWFVERQGPNGKWERVSDFIPATGGPIANGNYAWRDAAAEAGKSYSYRLIVVENRGGSRSIGPFDISYRPIDGAASMDRDSKKKPD